MIGALGGWGRRAGRVVPVACVAAGTVLLAAAAGSLLAERPGPGDFGVTGARVPGVLAGGGGEVAPAAHPAAAHPAAAHPGAAHPAAAHPQAAHPQGPSVAPDRASSAAPGPLRAAAPRPAPPRLLAIPALRVRASVDPVRSSDGVLGVPADPGRVGWWTGSALVGAPHGTVVVDGHVDSAVAGVGALFRLTELRSGARLVVTTAAGRRQAYEVVGRRVYRKAAGLPPALFATGGAPRLVVITCGGPFDRASGSYLDNVAVFAVPVRS